MKNDKKKDEMPKDNRDNKNIKDNKENSSLKRDEDSQSQQQRYPLDRILDEDFWFNQPGFWRIPKLISPFRGRWFPRVDISETNDEVKVVVDIPGIDPDNIDIDVRDSKLRISGKIEREKTDEKPYRYERSSGEFMREMTLPARIKEDQVRASCKDGVLTIVLPKVEEEKRKKITIEKE
jgi:HSP20 family protein